MAQLPIAGDKKKIRGIRQRWLLNSVSVVLFMIVLAVIVFSVAMARYYYDAMEEGLRARAGSAASFGPVRAVPPPSSATIPSRNTAKPQKPMWITSVKKASWSCSLLSRTVPFSTPAMA